MGNNRFVKEIKGQCLCGMLLLLLSACVNGLNEKGTPVNPDSIRHDTLATLSPNGDGFMLLDGMGTCHFDTLFDARVDGTGIVKCMFHGFEADKFKSLLSELCPREEITIENLEGRCCGIKCMAEGSAQAPLLLMILEDGHVERISLFELSEGKTQATHRSEQKGVVDFVQQISPEADGMGIYGLLADSSRIDLDWKSTEVSGKKG